MADIKDEFFLLDQDVCFVFWVVEDQCLWWPDGNLGQQFFFSCSSSFLSVCGKGVGWGGLLKESCSLALQFYGVEGI